MDLTGHSPVPPVCWLFAGLDPETGRFPSSSKHQKCAVPHVGFNVHFIEIAPVENVKDGEEREAPGDIINNLEQAERRAGEDVQSEGSQLTHMHEEICGEPCFTRGLEK